MQLALFSTTKICTKCNVEKHVSEYSKRKDVKDGLQSVCKQCAATYSRQHYTENKEIIREKQQVYRSENPDKIKLRNAHYNANNSDKINERVARYRSNNSDKISEYHKHYYNENKEKIQRQQREYIISNPDKVLIKNNRRRARKQNAAGNCDVIKLNNRKAVYGNKCYLCGDEATAIDHVKPLLNGGSNWPANLRPICWSCNSSKGAKWPYELHHIQLTRFAEFSQKFN